MDLREVGYDDRDWINLAQDRDRWRAYYGLWRLHEKIVPDWMPPKEPVTKTYRVEPVKETKETKEVTELQKTPSEPEVTGTQGQQFASA
ncbi:hypothetical protein ANN_00679 [Periplaneta americana]|uniref:Uncharacterized protein n=1 Tax=Periplaneta americana TaxID=6978 RepID=A0ABQ8TTW1_PERAM|nr:hypothetical protein ANN_00679 [Periplaneta americana]